MDKQKEICGTCKKIFGCKHRKLIHEDNQIVGNCDLYQKCRDFTQKELEEIKQMQKEIFDSCAWRFGKPEEDYREIANDIGEDLYDLGYQKIDKDKVVLSREEYEKLKTDIEVLGVELERTSTLLVNACKETAEKFAKEFDKILTKKLRAKREFICFGAKWYIEENTLYNTIYEVKDELAKQFGVEIKD